MITVLDLAKQDMLQNGVASRGQEVCFWMEFLGMLLLSAP